MTIGCTVQQSHPRHRDRRFLNRCLPPLATAQELRPSGPFDLFGRPVHAYRLPSRRSRGTAARPQQISRSRLSQIAGLRIADLRARSVPAALSDPVQYGSYGVRMTARLAPADIRAKDERADMTENALAADAIENAEATEPIDPMDKNDPTDPIDRTDPLDPMDMKESCDHSDSRLRVGTTAVCRGRPSQCSGRASGLRQCGSYGRAPRTAARGPWPGAQGSG